MSGHRRYRNGREATGNKAIVRRLIEEVVNGGETRLLPELIAADHVCHDPSGDLYGPEGVGLLVAELRLAFPDLRVTLDDLLADGDRVVRRFTLRGTHDGTYTIVPATGRRVEVAGIGIDRLAAGKLVESWIQLDALGLLRQLGVAPRRPDSPSLALPTPLYPHYISGTRRRNR
jgi:predicted ester cyclase